MSGDFDDKDYYLSEDEEPLGAAPDDQVPGLAKVRYKPPPIPVMSKSPDNKSVSSEQSAVTSNSISRRMAKTFNNKFAKNLIVSGSRSSSKSFNMNQP